MSVNAADKPYRIIDFDQIPGVACPCGTARRALMDLPAYPGTIHRTEITCNAKLHYHRRLTETYYILRCDADAQMQLDEERIPLRPGMAIYIPPGVQHRAIGAMSVLIVVFPKFDADDEVLVD